VYVQKEVFLKEIMLIDAEKRQHSVVVKRGHCSHDSSVS